MNVITYTTATGEVIDLITSEGLRDLRIEIAKRLGYRLEHEEVAWYVYQPDGSRHYATHAKIATDESSAWRNYINGTWRHFPDWTINTDAALGLLTDSENAIVELEQLVQVDEYKGWRAKVYIIRGGRQFQYFRSQATTPALAICLAWLAYMNADKYK